MSFLFFENRTSQKNLKTVINEIIHYYETQIVKIVNSNK